MTGLDFTDRGQGPTALLIHGTGTDSSYFEPAVGALSDTMRLVTYDRRGWGRSEPEAEYLRTSIAEQAIEAGGLLRDLGIGATTALGVGFGAVVALELALSEPGLITDVIMIEPPLFGMITAATEGMSADVVAIREAAEQGGARAAYELFLAGGLPTLGCGAERLGDRADRGRFAAHSFLVELPAVPAWPMDPTRVIALEAAVDVVTLPSTPPLLLEAAGAVIPRLPGANRGFAVRDGAEAVAEALAGRFA